MFPQPDGGGLGDGVDPADGIDGTALTASSTARADAGRALPRAVAVLERSIGEAPGLGAQLHVELGGDVVASVGLGEARPGAPMTADTRPVWLCCSKPVTALLFGALWEAGELAPDDAVCRYLPEFAGGAKAVLTLRHLLTHTGSIPYTEDLVQGAHLASHATIRARLAAYKPPAGARPGHAANYGTL